MAEAEAEAEFPYIPWDSRVIIATKGLPCTGKSQLAKRIGEWAKLRVYYMDDFLSTMSLDKGYNNTSRKPSGEESERLHRLAFHALCTSAHRYLQPFWSERCVVLKSRLCSTFELDRLLRLPTDLISVDVRDVTIIIIECHVKNELRLYDRLERIGDKEWYKARTRLDFEKARDDDWLSTTCTSTTTHPAARDEWDLHLCNLLTNNDEKRPKTRVIRLVLDPFLHLDLNESGMRGLTPAFQAAICYLIEVPKEEEGEVEVDWKQELIRDRYAVVHFDMLRRYLAEQELKSADLYYSRHKKNKYLCPTSVAKGGLGRRSCVLKTYTPTKHHHDSDANCNICGVCDEPVQASSDEEEEGGAYYTCHFCFLTLHKSCAEYQGGVTFPDDFQSNVSLQFHPMLCDRYLQGRTHACKSCKEGGRSFDRECDACLFQTHLKCRLFPTVINHDSHPQHLLSLQLGQSARHSNCKACPYLIVGKYGCYVCGLDYCLRCVLRPTKLEHTHGGHHHALDLVYTRDGMEPQEDYWCGVCGKDIDPDDWFYSCQNCPSYEAHPECIMPSKYV